jgi:hypothetical protein
VTTSQTDLIEWALSADGGLNWEDVPPSGDWHEFAHPGTDLLWRSTHQYLGGGVNPSCDYLGIEYEAQSTPVEEIFFAVATQSDAVMLRWTLESLSEVAGLSVHRSTSPEGPYIRVNDEVLPPSSPGSFEDTTVWPGTAFWYKLQAILTEGGEEVIGSGPVYAVTLGTLVAVMHPASPNPFRGETHVVFDIPDHAGPVSLEVYNVRGQLVQTLVDAPVGRGRHKARWDGHDSRGADVSSGVYFLRLRIGQDILTSKVLLME